MRALPPPRATPCRHPRPAAHRPPGPSAGEAALLGQLEVALGQLLDVDVLERHDPHVLDEPGGAVDVPHPRVGHGDVEVDVAADVAVLPVELQLHLGLVLLEVLGTHGTLTSHTCSSSPIAAGSDTADPSPAPGAS